MNQNQKKILKIRIAKLAKLKGTGSPSELANKMGISERSIKRFVKELRDEGFNIKYNRERRTYETEENYQ